MHLEGDISSPMLHSPDEVRPSRCTGHSQKRCRKSSRIQVKETLNSLYSHLRKTKEMGDKFRLVSRNGKSRVQFLNVPGESVRYLLDIFTTVIDAKWRYVVLLFSLSYILSWLLFASIWWLIKSLHDSNNTGKNCIDNVDSWLAAFLFSVETQSTIGYGGRQVTTDCPSGTVVLVIQTLVGMLINCSMLGLMFAKISRPKNRANTVLFSKRATVTKRNNKLCLCWQTLDIAKRRLFDCNIRAFTVRAGQTYEGEEIPFETCDLQLTVDQRNIDYTLRIFPLLPLTIMHVIDEVSPLYNMSELDIQAQNLEVIVVLEGTVPTTGMVTQVVASYTSEEIDWGYTFEPPVHRDSYVAGKGSFDVQNLSKVRKEKYTPRFPRRSFHREESESTGYDTESRSNSASLSSFGDEQFGKSKALDVVVTLDGNDI